MENEYIVIFHYQQQHGNAFYLEDGTYLGIDNYADSGPLLLENLNTLRILKEHYPDRGFRANKDLVSDLLKEVRCWVKQVSAELTSHDVRKDYFDRASKLIKTLLISPPLSETEMAGIRSNLITESKVEPTAESRCSA